MKYIEDVLGLPVTYHHWKGEVELPFYIMERYKMRLVEIGPSRCIFLWPAGELSQIGSLRKQIRRIRMEEALPVVFILESIDRYRRSSLISEGIPFVVPDSQLYLPFMGVVLQEKYYARSAPFRHLQPSAQLLLFYWVYRGQKRLYMNEAVKTLGLSAMTVTRAFRQLEETELFESGKERVQKYLESDLDTETLLRKSEEFLESPVSDTIYINREEAEGEGYLTAGESALYELGFCDEDPVTSCVAVSKKKAALSGSRVLLDASSQTAVQLWKYEPQILAENERVDPLSLALSMDKPVLSFWKKQEKI